MNRFSQPTEKTRPKVLRIWLWTQIWIHVLCGIVTLSFLFPFFDRQKKDQKIQEWSVRLLKIFHLELEVQGADRLPSTPYLLASNHISWMDIHVINAFKPIRFVAKSEVASWPIFGWMAKQLGTVFIRRDSPRHARQVAHQIAKTLEGESVCIFPEGTSTVGELVLPFKPNLFEAAIVSQTSVYPLAIQYVSKVTGLRAEAPAFTGDMGLLDSMSRILKTQDLVVRLQILPLLKKGAQGISDRKQLASDCKEAIINAI